MAKSRSRKRKNPGRRPAGGEPAGPQRLLTDVDLPEGLLLALDGNRDMLNEMVQAHMPSSPEEAIAGILKGWAPLLGPGTDQLGAELCGAEFLGMLRAMALDESDLPAMLADLIAQAEGVGTPPALAMARVLEVHGPDEMRGAATGAANRLVAAGLADPPWVRGLGTPTVGPSFGYVDLLGTQEVIATTFSYGRKAHALAVLIDHGLGGGIKDCWVTDNPRRIRSEYRKAANHWGLELRDYAPTEAHAILDKALGNAPCPVEPDQVEDVGSYLGLLRQRLTLLADGTQAGPARLVTLRSVHRLKITLSGSKPPIWRRLEVPSTITLERLHQIIQQAFGWAGYHLWVFETPYGEYGVPDPELGHGSAAAKKLDDVASRAGDRIRYTYDFGDDWDHDVRLEAVLTAEPGISYPRCVAGRRACPPEDCGGIWGYSELQEILADPGHPEHEGRLEWLSLKSADEFDPAEFDRNQLNESLSRSAKVLLKY